VSEMAGAINEETFLEDSDYKKRWGFDWELQFVTTNEFKLAMDAKELQKAVQHTLGRPMKLQVLPGAAPQASAPRPASPGAKGSPRGRAEQEPVVRRMMEKFGAEIRTVIDYKQKQ